MSPWLTIWLGSAAAVLAAVLVLERAPSYREQVGLRSNPPGSDFLQEWIGGAMLLRGDAERLYDWEYSRQLQHDRELTGFEWPAEQFYPMVYPPFYYVMVAPLAQRDCLTAARQWCLWNGLAYCLAFALLATACLKFSNQARWFPFLFLFYGPVLLSLNMGQKSGFILLLFVATYVLLSSGRGFWAGLVFGGLLFKPHLAVVVLAAMALQRRWLFLAGFGMTAATAGAVSLWVGAKPCWDFVQVGLSATRYMENGGYQWEHAHNLWCGLRGFVEADQRWTAATIYAVFATVLVGLVLQRCHASRDELPEGLPQAERFGMLVLLTVILSPHLFTYDLSLLLLPMSFVAARLMKGTPGADAGQLSARPGVWYGLLPGLLFLGSTWMPALAMCTGVQYSCWLLVAWLVVWIRDHARMREKQSLGGLPRAGWATSEPVGV